MVASVRIRRVSQCENNKGKCELALVKCCTYQQLYNIRRTGRYRCLSLFHPIHNIVIMIHGAGTLLPGSLQPYFLDQTQFQSLFNVHGGCELRAPLSHSVNQSTSRSLIPKVHCEFKCEWKALLLIIQHGHFFPANVHTSH